MRVALASAAAAACARPGAPGGGPPDQRPPVVIATVPAPGAFVESLDFAIDLRFSERISERVARGTLDEAVLLSPRTGAVRVNHKSDALEVSVEGGLRPDLVYRLTVLPVLVDLFGNRMSEPFELAFSTGPELIENAIAGQVLDRITGRTVQDRPSRCLRPRRQPTRSCTSPGPTRTACSTFAMFRKARIV